MMAPGDLIAGGELFELFFRNAQGALVFRLRGDEPFLPALVSGALVPFGPTRWGPPATSVRLLGGATTYHALEDCAASATPLAAGAAPIPRPVAPYAPGTFPVPAGWSERAGLGYRRDRPATPARRHVRPAGHVE
jgi:hypothetical protein